MRPFGRGEDMNKTDTEVWHESRIVPFGKLTALGSAAVWSAFGLFVVTAWVWPGDQARYLAMGYVVLATLCFLVSYVSFRSATVVRIRWNDVYLWRRSLFFGERRYRWADLTVVEPISTGWGFLLFHGTKRLKLRFGPKTRTMSIKSGSIDPRNLAAIEEFALIKLDANA